MATNWKFNKDGTIEDKDGNKVKFENLVINNDGKVKDIKGDDVDVVVADAQKLGGKEATEYTDREEVDFKSHIMSESEFNNIVEYRKQILNNGSKLDNGWLTDTNNIYEDGGYSFGNFDPKFINRKPYVWYSDTSYSNTFTIGLTERTSNKKLEYNIGGVKIIDDYLGYGKFKCGDAADIKLVIKDSSNLESAISQTDMMLLKDFDREMVDNGTFDDNIDGWGVRYSDDTVEHNSDSGTIKFTMNTSEYGLAYTSIRTIPGVEYRISAELVSGKDIRLVAANNIDTDHIKIILGNRDLVFTAENYTTYIGIGIDYATETWEEGDVIEFDNVSVKQNRECAIFAIDNADSGMDIYAEDNLFEAEDDISRTDLLALEKWLEDISITGVVYKNGCVQSVTGNDVSFDGSDTYSLFGNHQQPGDFVGKGYVWEDMTAEEKIDFVKNPDNNMVITNDGKVLQHRYRYRVIHGLGNRFTNILPENAIHSRVCCNIHDYSYGLVSPKGMKPVLNKEISQRIVEDDYGEVSEYGTFQAEGLSYYNKQDTAGLFINHPSINKEVFSYDGSVYLYPIARIQRLNKGIYHSVYNPSGTARLINDAGDGVEELETYIYTNDKITCVEDCFNADLIAAIDSDGNIVRSSSDDAVWDSGEGLSKISGHIAGKYHDDISYPNVEDLRIATETPDLERILNIFPSNIINRRLTGESKLIRIDNSKPTSYKMFYVYNDTDCAFYSNYYWNKQEISYSKNKMLIKVNNKIFSVDPSDIFKISGDYVQIRNSDLINLIRKEFNMTTGYVYNNWYDKNSIANDDNSGLLYQIGLGEANIKETSFKFFNTLYQTEILGDYRKLVERIELTITDSDEQVTITKNEYVKCDDGTNNGGVEGHIYRYVGDAEITNIHTNSDDGDANTNDGHIDLSDSDYWLDLGDDGELGGYPDFYFTDNIAAEMNIYNTAVTTKRQLPIDDDATYAEEAIGKFTFNKKLIYGTKCFVRKKDNSWVEIPVKNKSITTDSELAGYFEYRSNNVVVGGKDSVNNLGYDSEEEMRDLALVMFTYSTGSKTTTYTTNGNILKYPKDINVNFKDNYSLITQDLINKVSTSSWNSNYCRNLIQTGYHKPSGTAISSYNGVYPYTPTHDKFENTPTTSPAVKYIIGVKEEKYRLYLFIVFKEIIYDGDDGKLDIFPNVSKTILDENGNYVIYGYKKVRLPFYVKKDYR